MSTQTVQLSLLLPGRFNHHDNQEKLTQIFKFCIHCGSGLLGLGDQYSNGGVPPGGPDTGSPQTATGAYCGQCGIQLLNADKAKPKTDNIPKVPSQLDKEDIISEANTDSLTRTVSLSRLGKVLDEEYQTWEDRLQVEFKDFLASVRSHFTKKEKSLQEYQIDLCQREKELQTSEEIYQEKMTMLKESEEELKKRMNSARESVALQIQNKIEAFRAGCRDVAVQTELILDGVSHNIVNDRDNNEDQPDGSFGFFAKSPNTSIKPQNDEMRSDSRLNKSHDRSMEEKKEDVTLQEQKEAPYYYQSRGTRLWEKGDTSYNASRDVSYQENKDTSLHEKVPPRVAGGLRQPGYQPFAYSADVQHQYNQQNQPYTSSPLKQENINQPQSSPFSYSSTSSQVESPEALDRSSSRSSNVPAQMSRVVTSPGATSMTARSRSPSAEHSFQYTEYELFQRSRLGKPPPPPGALSGSKLQRYDKRSHSAEMLDAFQQHIRTQSPSPDRDGMRSFSADKVESPRSKTLLPRGVLRSQSADKLLDERDNHGNINQSGLQSPVQSPTTQSPKRFGQPSQRREVPPYNGPPAYSRHPETKYSYNSPPSHSRESSINGQGEAAMIESRTLDVQVARSKSVSDSNVPSPKEKAVKFGVAVFPPTSPESMVPKSYPKSPANEDAEPEMTSTPVDEKQIEFPSSSTPKYNNVAQPQAQSKPPQGSSKWAMQRAQAGSKIAAQSPPSRLAAPSYKQYGKQNGSQPYRTAAPRANPGQALRTPGKVPQPQSNPRSATQITPGKTGRQYAPPRQTNGEDLIAPNTSQQTGGAAKPYDRRQLQKPRTEINNNRPISDYADDEVFVQEEIQKSSATQLGGGGGNPYYAAQLAAPNNQGHQEEFKEDIPKRSAAQLGGAGSPSYGTPLATLNGKGNRNVTTHTKSRIAQSPRSLPTYKSSPSGRGIPKPSSGHRAQQPEPQQPVSNRHNQNQNNGGDQSNLADESTSSIVSSTQNRYFDFSPTYKGLYHRYHSPGTIRRYNERKQKEQLQREKDLNSQKSPTWRSRSRLPNYGKYISEIQEMPVPTNMLNK